MALILEAMAFVPRHYIKFFHPAANFLQTPKSLTQKAKDVLLHATRQTLHQPKR